MRDLVERLRAHTGSVGVGGCQDCYAWLMDDAADRIEALEAALWEVVVTMRHAHIFITSREKMHPTGVELYDELLTKIAALAPEQDK